MRLTLIALLAALAISATPARADTLHVTGAGSLTAAFTDIIRRFPAGPDTIEPPEFGPSGLMRQRIETSGGVDLFASADMDQARRLAAAHPDRMVINFTRNRLCALARDSLALTPANMLDKLLDPAIRVATSTPGADPAGDYAWQVFARADSVRPGARATLDAKALKLVGGGDKTPLLVPGKGAVEGVFLADKADIMLGYCSGAADVTQAAPGLVSTALPPAITVGPAYGMVLLNTKPVTLRFAAFVMSEAGQAVLRDHGFDPVGFVEPGQPQRGVLVQRAGQPPAILAPERLAELKPATQHVTLVSTHGEEQNEWSGPLLWDVLTEAGAVDPARPAEQVRLTVRVTGADGYSVLLALAELSPEFAARPIQLADRMNGTPFPGHALRLIVPDEHRAGRSVRDVIRIDVN